MPNKRVLIVTYYWPPAGGIAVIRWVKFVKYLQEFGWEPVVYTVSNGSYPLLDVSLEKDVPENITVIKRPIWEPYSIYKLLSNKKGNTGGRDDIKAKKSASFIQKVSIWLRGNFFIPDARVWWIRPSVSFLSDYLRANPVDAIISTGPPHSMHLIGLGVHKKLGIPWLADFRDPWTTMDYYKDLMLTRWGDSKHRRYELGVLKTASAVSVVGYAMKKEFEGKRGSEVDVVSNGFDASDFLKSGNVKRDDDFTIAHIGSFFPRRNPVALWQAIKELKEEGHESIGSLKIKLIGKVDVVVKDAIEANGLNDMLELVAFMPREDAIKHMKAAQVLLLPIDNFEGAQWVLTGKLFEYLAAERPVLCIGPADGDAAQIIREVKAGETFGFTDVAGIKEYLKHAYSLYKKGELDLKGGQSQAFSHRELTKKVAGILDSISA